MTQCPPYSLGNQVWQDSNNNGQIDDGEKPIAGVTMLLFESVDGEPVDQNDDGIIDARDAIDTTTTDANGLYLFSGLQPGNYQVGVAPSNWNTDGPLFSMRSSDPTEDDPNDDVDGNDNGIESNSMVLSGPVYLGDRAEPTGEDPDNDENADSRSNLTVDFGFYLPKFDLALRKTLAEGQPRKVKIGDTVTFDITVFNQGDVIGNEIEVTDYIPVELELNDSRWTPGPGRSATQQLVGALAPGDSRVVQIKLKVIKGAARIDNYAEISSQLPVDSEGGTITTPTGVPISDIDSVPDDIRDNDELIDDEINKTPATGDEDDHDIASIVVDGWLALTGAGGLGLALLGLVLLGSGGGLVWLIRRRQLVG